MSSKNSTPRPPRFADWLLESLCSYDYLSTALWDLEELFEYHVKTKGVIRAKWLYLKESLSIIYHLYFKGQSQFALNPIAMFKNNLTIALRNFNKHRSYVLLNVIGLAFGLTVFLLITRYTSYEFSYDTHHENADRIYRVYKELHGLEEQWFDAGTPGPLAKTLLNEFPEVEHAARFSSYGKQLMLANNKSFVEPVIHAVDPSVFEIFSLEILHGDPIQALNYGPNIAISESVAMKYFGHSDVVNEIISYRNQIPLTISAVYKDMPVNSDFIMDLIVNFEWTNNAFEQDLTNWNNNPFYTYILLKEGSSAIKLEAKLPEIRAKYANDPIDEDGQSTTYYLQPLTDVHFASHINWGMEDAVDASRLNVFNVIALIVLMMAGINYVNLATARAMVRVKETGIRKIMGARRPNLLSQFLIESGLLVFGSLVTALMLAHTILPIFAHFVDRPLAFDFINPIFWLQLGLLGLVITFASGLYPAFFMSSFNPLYAISNRGKFKYKSLLRNGLVILQFGLSAILILSAIVLQRQMSFIDTVDTGYTRDQVVILSTRDDAFDDKLSTYMEEIGNVRGVEAVATSWSLPTNVTSNTQANWPGIDDAQRIQMYMVGVTHDFFKLYEIEIKEGRAFDQEIKTDQSAIILNEAAVKAFGWDNPIGREMIRQNGETGTVIGVVKDFHIKSLKEEIQPLQIVLNPNYATLAVRVSGDLNTTMASIEKVYDSFEPSYPFEYRFFEDIYARAYAEDTRTGQLTLAFSFLAIVIACLGLYGLASHKVALRIKELGVRKVMGASSLNIAQLLFKDFLVLVTFAFMFAGPIAYFIISSWLENYAYHIDLTPIPFVATFLILILFAGTTVGYHTYKASVSNPVHSLKDE
ncbi:MAG: ABC transporter permease [Cytophagales bacterium]|nr:ABC transporter permease [Cytophagales bacterium]